MTLRLRHRHRRMFAVLGVLLLLAFTAGLVARKQIPTTDALPPELLLPTQTFTATDYERDDLFEKSPVKVRLWKDLSTGQLAVGFLAPKDFLRPDLMVYWVAARPPASNGLPADAVLLGSFFATVLALPAEAKEAEGTLILFSLANQEIVDVSKAFRVSVTGMERGPVTRSNSAPPNSPRNGDDSSQSKTLRPGKPRSDKDK